MIRHKEKNSIFDHLKLNNLEFALGNDWHYEIFVICIILLILSSSKEFFNMSIRARSTRRNALNYLSLIRVKFIDSIRFTRVRAQCH